jgi:phage-related protein
MSNILSIATVLEKNRIDSDVPFVALLDIEVVDPQTQQVMEILSYAANPEALVFNTVTYQPAKFDLTFKSESGSQPDVSLTVNDYSQVIQGRMQAYAGGVGFGVTVTIVNAARLNDPPEWQLQCEVMSAGSADFTTTWKLGAPNALALPFPRRRQTKDFCQWRFKSAECGYAGAAATCDLTLQGANGCSAKNNTINFGGYPGMNSNGLVYS